MPLPFHHKKEKDENESTENLRKFRQNLPKMMRKSTISKLVKETPPYFINHLYKHIISTPLTKPSSKIIIKLNIKHQNVEHYILIKSKI